jgi:uncharacterized repeat protein (TIGR01451 family)
VAESCPNGVVDPGETVTISFSLQNVGTGNTTNLVATLLANGGVTAPSGPQTYGVLTAGGAAFSASFTFTASGICGGTVAASLQLQDGQASLGTVNFNLPLGQFVTTTDMAQNFDSVSAPALPAGWTTTATGAESPWATSTAASDTSPNAAFVPDPASVGLSELVSPNISVSSASAQLTFRNYYNLEASTSTSIGYDGGVLEIKLGTGAFTDILSAGGSFVSGGYNRTLSSSYGNPLAGRQAWSGNSGGFITTVVNLPAAAAGQTIQLKWRCGSDNSVSKPGWYIDTVSITDGGYVCCTPNADLRVSQSVSPHLAVVGQSLSYTLTVANLGPSPASNVTLTDALPSSASFVSASAGGNNQGGTVVCNLGTLPNGGATNVTIVVNSTGVGFMTNVATVAASTPDPNPANNTVTIVTAADLAPAITAQPANQVAGAGANVNFKVSATGTAPMSYQWRFGSANLAGATTSTLSLTNVQPAQAGSYLVVVTNVAGSVTSAPASLRVLVRPTLSPVTLAANRVSISVTSVLGLNYTLQYKNSLADASWTALTPSVTGSGGVLLLQDTSPPALSRFYRVVCQ